MTNAPAPPRPLWPLAPWLAEPLAAHRGLYVQVCVAAVLANMFALATSFYSMTVYNSILPNAAIWSLIGLTVGMAIVVCFDFVVRMLRGYFIDAAGQAVDAKVGAAIFDRLLDTPLARRGRSNGALAGLLREFETLRDFFSSATVTALVDVPFVLLFVLVIALIAGPLALVPLVMVPVVLLGSWAVQPGLDRIAGQQVSTALSKQGVMVEAVSALETLRVTSAGHMLRKRWIEAVLLHAEQSLRSRLLVAFAVQISASAQQIVYVGTIVGGVFMVADGTLSSGALIAASILSGRCVAPLGQVAQLLTRIAAVRASHDRLDGFMNQPETMAPTVRHRPDGGLSLQHVRFTYPGTTQRVLDDFTLNLARGERVALVGRVGSGKSTALRIALGLYPPDEGSVLVDGADLRQYAVDDLRAGIGAVLQDVVLFSGSVRDNITLGDDIPDDEIIRAARLTGVHDMLGHIPNGYDLMLADRGEGLSGGQRQALSITRALVRRPPILIMDEPTSAMDARSEAALIARLQTELRGRTLLLCTHRPAVLALVDRVAVVDGGRVVADGPRDEMIKRLQKAA
jgi:ATP-binding cassette, subfamily C, bacterial LapB